MTLELIRSRRSVRSFNGQPLRNEDAEELIAYAEALSSPYDIPIHWLLLNGTTDGLKSPVITGTDTFIAGKMDKVPHAEEAFGYVFEKIVLHAWSKGIGTTWIAGTMDRPAFEKAVGLSSGEVMPCISPLGYPAEKMSVRETLMRKGVKADSRMDAAELFFKDSFPMPLSLPESDPLSQVLEMVRWAPSAVNRQPWRILRIGNTWHFYEKRSKGYVSADGWDLQKIDMGIALSHFEIGLEEQGHTWEFIQDDPGIELPEDTIYIASYILK